MKPTRLSAVVEIFFPGGYARDYEWTSRSLGMRHYSVWNDTYGPSFHSKPPADSSSRSYTHPNELQVPGYPDGFHGTEIPVYAPLVAQLIDDHVTAREHGSPSVGFSPLHDIYDAQSLT